MLALYSSCRNEKTWSLRSRLEAGRRDVGGSSDSRGERAAADVIQRAVRGTPGFGENTSNFNARFQGVVSPGERQIVDDAADVSSSSLVFALFTVVNPVTFKLYGRGVTC